MIEQGLVMLIQQGLATAAITVPGGYFAELPKDTLSTETPQAWSYRTVTVRSDYVLAGQTGWTEWCVQIDCHGYAADSVSAGAALAVKLARAIDNVLRGPYQGTLPDPDSTYVFGIYRESSGHDGFSDSNRSFVRSTEYRVIYQQI